MYFEIENTPEHIRKARRVENVNKASPKEECPRLVLAPFSRPPQVVFENVLVGTSCERNLEVLNPTKQVQEITLGRSLPPGLVIELPGEWLVLEPETCYCLTMLWTPTQPTALRETIRFTNENRGRYDVIVVLKSVMHVKVKQLKGFKTSPGKMKKKQTKKSPVAIYKKKAEAIYNSTKVKKVVTVQTTQHKVFKASTKENIMYDDNSMDTYRRNKCPFDSSNSFDFNTSEVFSNMRKPNTGTKFHTTYEKSNAITDKKMNITDNILKPSNRQKSENSVSDIFDNLTFTPLKTLTKTDKLEKGPKIILSMNSDSEFDDCLDMKTGNKENQTHSIISVTSSQPPNRWVTIDQKTQLDSHIYSETPNTQNKKIPNTSSPKEMNSPNFSINTEFSRISDLSFYPQRFSTERKLLPKPNNDTHDLMDDLKLNSDTYTKDSPNTPVELPTKQMYLDTKPPHFFLRDQYPRMCRQSLFREYQQQREVFERNSHSHFEPNVWRNDLRVDIKSPPRSLTPPLQSIPEESTHLTDTQVLEKSSRQMDTFTINRTFDKLPERASISSRQSWSKKAVRIEPEIWKMPVPIGRKSLKPKASLNTKKSLNNTSVNTTFESNKTIQNITVNQIGNVYSQSFTVDPFLSTTYFYDEEAVDKFEKEFKRWLNCILTPPADLDSNIEQKIDVGKAWLENRNKDVPLAPTKEYVSSVYHNSRRLASLRKSARVLLMSTEIAQVFQKLNAQIEKKLIAIRNDRNLHLDVGLQKIIMEILLSYNPLWLRIGLEAIYGLVMPLKSNSDIEGLTTFIIQRMFKNPHLKNKHSKSSAPNMLLPAYIEAIKKFTLKKFFMLVYFLDQAKQRKIIPHDPCLFCRNAICKESREVILRFTRELIAGIGDITKHLRPLGYVVSHKQSYLDEYKYAVHNIAVDIRDGVRITKVMEIILMKNGLLNQLRTPAISRLQKIHNVQVALNALKEANFVIVGEITANDIADGHREKTLSLLWQLIHVFRAPLFEKAANVIQTWWRKKYEVIVEKRKEEERQLQAKHHAASVIQCWWRRIQYNRLVEWKMHQVTTATIIIQKYYRMWACRSRLRKVKRSVMKIEDWYKSIKLAIAAKKILDQLKAERAALQVKSAVLIQSYIRRWLCIKRFKMQLRKIIIIQSVIRCVIARKYYLQLKKSVRYVQQYYRGKMQMKLEMQKFADLKEKVILLQSYWRMVKQLRNYRKIKLAAIVIEERYIALVKMRSERLNYLNLKTNVIKLQALFRGRRCLIDYAKQKESIIKLQRRIKAQLLMRNERQYFLRLRSSAIIMQKYMKAYLIMKEAKHSYDLQRKSAIVLQRYFRSYLLAKSQRKSYLCIRSAATILQNRFRALLLMRQDKSSFFQLKHHTIIMQRRYRANIVAKQCRDDYLKLRTAVLNIQNRYRARKQMINEKSTYLKLKSSCLTIQRAYRAYALGKQEKQSFQKTKKATLTIQHWYRNITKSVKVKQDYQRSKAACVTIQRIYRAYIIGQKQRQEYIKIKTATIRIQTYYRSYIEMRTLRQQYIQLKTSTVTIQRYYRSHLETRKVRSEYMQLKHAAQTIQRYYKEFKQAKKVRHEFVELKNKVIYIQRKYRSIRDMKIERNHYLTLKLVTVALQQRFRAFLAMRVQRRSYIELKSAAIIIQRRFRAQMMMKIDRHTYTIIVSSCVMLQRFYRACALGKRQRLEYLKLKQATITLQQKYRALLNMRRERKSYLCKYSAIITIQNRYRAQRLMLQTRSEYLRTKMACITIQRRFRAFRSAKEQKTRYTQMKAATILIQRRYRLVRHTKIIRGRFLRTKEIVIMIQRRFRANIVARENHRTEAAKKIQMWYKTIRAGKECRQHFLKLKQSAVILQSAYRMYVLRDKYVRIQNGVLSIQRFYRAYKQGIVERERYSLTRRYVITIQSHIRSYIERKRFLRVKSAVLTIQTAYRMKKESDLTKRRREVAAIVIQKNVRRYFVQSSYLKYRKCVILVQKIWRGKLVTRLMRCEFLQKRTFITKFQAIVRGYLVRKKVQQKKENLLKIREEQRCNWAASKIQALFRGHQARVNVAHDTRITELRRRWRRGALQSTQESLKERNEEAMEVLRYMADIETVIRAFRSLELLTEVFPMMYNANASSIVRRVYILMSVTNRSISSIEVLKSAASVLVNLTRYRVTGPKIYARDRIPPILKYMWRFTNSETQLFCIMATYLWLFSKYDDVKKDLTEFLHQPENHKMLVSMKGNVQRMNRMAHNFSRNKFTTPQPKRASHVNHSINASLCSNSSSGDTAKWGLLPALEPDYGIVRADKPRYFEDANQAISYLFHTYNL